MMTASLGAEIRHTQNNLLLFDHLLDLSVVPASDILGNPVGYARASEQEFLRQLPDSPTLYADFTRASLSTTPTTLDSDSPSISESRFKEFFPTEAAYIWVVLALSGKNVIVTNTGLDELAKPVHESHYRAALEQCQAALADDRLNVGTITFL